MSTLERLKLYAYRLMPDSITPADLKGRLVVNAFLKGNGRSGGLSRFEKEILKSRGTLSSIKNYLSGSGKSKIPAIVRKSLGDKWYSGIASLLSRTPIGRDIVIDKVIDKANTGIGGNKDLAKLFLDAGGQV